MDEHPNAATLHRAYEAFATGDQQTLRDAWTDDVIWHVSGIPALDGDYHGPDEVMRFLGGLAQESGGSFRLDVHAVLADDEHGVVLVTTHAERRGQSRSGNSAHVMHLREGKIAEFWSAHVDPAGELAFWGP